MAQLSPPSGQVVTGSDLPIFWLGDFVVDTVSRGIENFSDAVRKVMRKWSNDFVVRRLLDLMIIFNPRLNARQQHRLMSILLRAVDQLFWERSLDPRVMRGIVALACPNQDTGLLFGYLMEVVAGLACNNGHLEECMGTKPTQLDVESPMPHSVQTCDEDLKIAQILFHQFCVDRTYVAAMPSKVRKAVLQALTGSAEFPSQLQGGLCVPIQQPLPICCITLEPLLCQDGTITADVVAVVQSSMLGKEHAFLYHGQALLEWLGHSQVPKNPQTRSLVIPTDIYRLS